MNKFIIFDLLKVLLVIVPVTQRDKGLKNAQNISKILEVISDWKELFELHNITSNDECLLIKNDNYINSTINVVFPRYIPVRISDILNNDLILKEMYNHAFPNILNRADKPEDVTQREIDWDDIEHIPRDRNIVPEYTSIYVNDPTVYDNSSPNDHMYYVGSNMPSYIIMTKQCARRLIKLTVIGDIDTGFPSDDVPMHIHREDFDFISKIPDGQPIIVDYDLLYSVVHNKSPIYVLGGIEATEVGDYLGGGGLYNIIQNYRNDFLIQMELRRGLIAKINAGYSPINLFNYDEMARMVTWKSWLKSTGTLTIPHDLEDLDGIGKSIIPILEKYDIMNILEVSPPNTILSKFLLYQPTVEDIYLLVNTIFPNTNAPTNLDNLGYGDFVTSYVGSNLPISAGVDLISEGLVYKKLDVVIIHATCDNISANEYINLYINDVANDATILFLNYNGPTIDGMYTITSSSNTIIAYEYDIPRLYNYNPNTLLDIGVGRSDIQHIRFMNHSGNDAYRLGDTITQGNDARYVIKLNFENTIAGSYIKILEETGIVGFDTVDKAVAIHMDKYNYDTPSRIEWSIFIRYGDKIDLCSAGIKSSLELLKSKSVRSVNLFTGIVYNSYKHSSSSHNMDTSLRGLEMLYDMFNDAGIKLIYKTSDNPDQDFAFLYHSTNVIFLGGSTFQMPTIDNIIQNRGNVYFDNSFTLQTYMNMLNSKQSNDILSKHGLLNTREMVGNIDYVHGFAGNDAYYTAEVGGLYRLKNPTNPEPENPKPKLPSKICIYSALFGGRDAFTDPIVDLDVDWILFTDDRSITSDIWEVRYSDVPPDTSPSIYYKRFKCLPHTYLSEYELCIWMDHNIVITSSIFLNYLLENFLSDGILVINHIRSDIPNVGNNLLTDELSLSLENPKYLDEPLQEQVDNYLAHGYPNDFGMFLSGIMLYNISNFQVRSFCTTWYLEIMKYTINTPQCQISLSYLLWKDNIIYDAINLDIYRSDMVIIDEARGWSRR